MICNFLNALKISRDFELKMKMVGKWIDSERRHKVKITEEQLGILEYCATWGIDDISDLSDALSRD